MKTRVVNFSAVQGYRRSRLPKFLDEWISYIKATTDYVGIDQYSSILVAAVAIQDYSVHTGFDNGSTYIRNTSWPETAIPLHSVTPFGLHNFLVKMRDDTINPPVRIPENGFSDTTGTTCDYERISSFYEYLKAVLQAIKFNGFKV